MKCLNRDRLRELAFDLQGQHESLGVKLGINLSLRAILVEAIVPLPGREVNERLRRGILRAE